MLISSPVFVEVIKSKSGKIYETFLVRESFRTPDGPRSRTVCNISSLPPQTRDLVSQSLKGLTLVSPLSASLHNALDYGGLAVLREAWTRFGLPEFFGTIHAEHAFGTSAMSPASGPGAIRAEPGTGGTMLLRFPRNLAADDVLIVPEVSFNLTSWSHGPADIAFVSETPAGDGTANMAYRVTPPSGTDGAFVRLRISSR